MRMRTYRLPSPVCRLRSGSLPLIFHQGLEDADELLFGAERELDLSAAMLAHDAHLRLQAPRKFFFRIACERVAPLLVHDFVARGHRRGALLRLAHREGAANDLLGELLLVVHSGKGEKGSRVAGRKLSRTDSILDL